MNQWSLLPEIKGMDETSESDNMPYNSPAMGGLTMKNYMTGMNLK
jgi:hypothetical protein